MDALERCARMVRDTESADGRMPDAHYVDQAEWEAIELIIRKQHAVGPTKQMGEFWVCGVPVRKFEIVAAGRGPFGQDGVWWVSPFVPQR